MGAEGHFARFLRPRNCGRIAAKIPAVNTAALADGSVLALHAALLVVNRLGGGEVGAAANYDGAGVLVMLGHLVAKVFFGTIQLVRGQKITVGELVKPVFVARNPRKTLHITIPGS